MDKFLLWVIYMAIQGFFFCSQFCQPVDSPVTKCDKITPCKVGRDEFGFEFEREIIIIKIMRAFRN